MVGIFVSSSIGMLDSGKMTELKITAVTLLNHT